MNQENLKDVAGNIIGHIETQDDGKQVLKDAENEIKGYYEPDADHTRDADYNIVAKGNRIRSLIC